MWTNGYVQGIEYSYGYYNNLSPFLQNFLLWHQRLQRPQSKEMNYLELGCGQGVSHNIHAAAQAGKFWAIDFNPVHILHAKEVANSFGDSSRIAEDSFAEFAKKAENGELPKFNHISLHGIWSWVSKENRDYILTIIRCCLIPGGAVYVSYNTLPGWSGFTAIRDLMILHQNTQARGSNMEQRISDSMDFIANMDDVETAHFKNNQLLSKTFSALHNKDPHYLAHELFNQEWYTPLFAEANADFESVKLKLCSTMDLLDSINLLHINDKSQKMLAEIDNSNFRETVRDFCLNRRFRQDLYIRGKVEVKDWVWKNSFNNDMKFILLTPPEDIKLKVSGVYREISLSGSVYDPVIDNLAKVEEPVSVSYLSSKIKKLTQQDIFQAVCVLIGKGNVAPTQNDDVVAEASIRTRKLNAFLSQKAQYSSENKVLSSPVTGMGYLLPRIKMHFVHLLNSRFNDTDIICKKVWESLDAQGKRILKNNKPIETARENIDEIKLQYNEFKEKELSILKKIKIVL